MIIPEVRQELLKIAHELEQNGHKPIGRRLRELEGELYRRRGVHPTKVRSQAITPDLKRQIRTFKAAWPDKSEQQIAAHFKVNMGRVSEALIGKRR